MSSTTDLKETSSRSVGAGAVDAIAGFLEDVLLLFERLDVDLPCDGVKSGFLSLYGGIGRRESVVKIVSRFA